MTFINLPRGHRGKSRSERIYKWWKPHLAAFFQGSSMEKTMCFVGKMTYKWLIPCIYTGRYHELVGWWIDFVGQLIYMVILDDIGPWCFFWKNRIQKEAETVKHDETMNVKQFPSNESQHFDNVLRLVLIPSCISTPRTAALIRFGSNARVNFFALLQWRACKFL